MLAPSEMYTRLSAPPGDNDSRADLMRAKVRWYVSGFVGVEAFTRAVAKFLAAEVESVLLQVGERWW